MNYYDKELQRLQQEMMEKKENPCKTFRPAHTGV